MANLIDLIISLQNEVQVLSIGRNNNYTTAWYRNEGKTYLINIDPVNKDDFFEPNTHNPNVSIPGFIDALLEAIFEYELR